MSSTRLNVIANLFGRIWGVLATFLFVPVYIKMLGFESYSLISFTLVLAGVLAILDAGLTATLSRELARGDVAKTEKYNIFKSLESAYFLLVLLIIVMVIILAKLIAEYWIIVEDISNELVAYYIRIFSFDIAFQLLFRFYLGGLLGSDKHVKANIYQVCWGVLRNAMVLIFLSYSPTLESFFIWQSLSTMVAVFLIKGALEKELLGRSKYDFLFRFDFGVFKKVQNFAFGMLLVSVLSALNTQLDKLIISKLLPVASLGHYMLGVSLATGIIVVISPIGAATLPKFTAYFSTQRLKEAKELFAKGTVIISIIIFTILSNFCLFSEEILWIWTGDLFLAKTASSVLPLLAMAFSFIALQIMPFHIAIANGYTRLNHIIGVLSVCLFMPALCILIPMFGVLGAAVTSFTLQFVSWFVYLILINKRFLNFAYLDLFVKQVLFPFIVSGSLSLVFGKFFVYFAAARFSALLFLSMSSLLTMLLSVVLLIPKAELKGLSFMK